jgi:tetratricopeptide (TPR) repeat protein/thiol-disulfide isomerase/thioredoxin
MLATARACLMPLILSALPLFSADRGDAIVGRPAPDFTLKDLDGRDVQLTSLKGKVVVLDFWATWCGPCRLEIPIIERIYKQYGKKGVAVLGVNEQESGDIVRKYVERNKISYPVLLTSGDSSVIGAYGAHALPTVAVVDKNGIVAAYRVGTSPVIADVLHDDIRRVSSPDYVAPPPKKIIAEAQNAPLVSPAPSSSEPDPKWQPKTAGEFLARAFIRLKLHQNEQAKADAEQALNLAPDSVDANFLHGRAAYDQRDYSAAIEDFDKVIRARPDWAEGYRYRGLAYSYYGQHQRALPDYQKAIELNPYYAHAYNALGWAYTQLGRFEEAKANLDKAIELEPDLMAAHENLAKLFAKQRNFQAELDELTMVCGLQPNNVWAKDARTAALEQLGSAKKAEPLADDSQ